jgi:hypothetical protein
VAVAGPRIWNFASGFGCGCSLSVGASSCRGCVGVDVDMLASAELGQAGAAWASGNGAAQHAPHYLLRRLPSASPARCGVQVRGHLDGLAMHCSQRQRLGVS